MIRNIVFDMGNVLLRFDRNCFMDRIGLTDPSDRKWMDREVFFSLEWAMTDRGSLTPEEAASIMRRRVPERLGPFVERLVCGWAEKILPMPGMEALISELKASGYGVYLLSNAGTNHSEYWPRVPGNELFDGLLVSAEVGCIKPEREIYKLLIDHGFKPQGGNPVTESASAKGLSMVSPSGFAINLAEHIKD